MVYLTFWLGVGITYLGVVIAIFESAGSGLITIALGLLFCALSYFWSE